jgi:Flp pilus assembly protein TadG
MFPLLRARRAQRRGAAAVEMAVVSPVVVLLVLGMIEVSRGVMVQHLLTNAARDGARSAVLSGAEAGAVEAQVADYLSASSVPGSTVAVSPNPLTLAQSGDPVSVTVSVPFNAVSWVPAPWFLEGKTLSSTVMMRREVSTAAEETEP